MKKLYITPIVELVTLNTRNVQLLAASAFDILEGEVSGSDALTPEFNDEDITNMILQ